MSYPHNSIGGIIHFLRYYCINIADDCTVGEGKVVYHNETVATCELPLLKSRGFLLKINFARH